MDVDPRFKNQSKTGSVLNLYSLSYPTGSGLEK